MINYSIDNRATYVYISSSIIYDYSVHVPFKQSMQVSGVVKINNAKLQT